MNKLKNFFRLKENIQNKKKLMEDDFDQYFEIGKLVKEARIQQNLSIGELARISRIPENSREENFSGIIPEFVEHNWGDYGFLDF